ncbi:low-specificity L-threonine aldolase [Alkalimonas collagenimarina]|uniref:Low-specificity L-threonine aldolase n=1 Tax=Alkalimonas collagenimarina TaxID=400390 RepID=A0ABT9GUR9_9GAMM|nr:low-specificity L-threonine aldolase [Alkalimonas collagenimarina]MDP4534799.1 low-specificity L-threonine aldolase [Alkalimonas collagenimarina]
MIDFRSDTVTQPTMAMKEAMVSAALGDDVFQDDPTTNQLQRFAAEQLGFEAALFAPSGTQTNLIAMMSHCQRGDEVIVGQQWHTYRWEAGGMAVLGSMQPQPLELQDDGSLALEDIAAAIKPDDPHFARTRLIVIENTVGGKVLSPEYMAAVAELAKKHQLACHIDGARLMNAASRLATDHQLPVWQMARQLCQGYDSLSLCLSKGLGAPVGSLLLGSASFIQRAHRIRKMLGGGMRQTGMLAAAGLYALQHHVERLVDDHKNCQQLADGLWELTQHYPVLQGQIALEPVQTNILFCDMTPELAAKLVPYLQLQGVQLSGSNYSKAGTQWHRLRWVCHLDISSDDILYALKAMDNFARSYQGTE